MKETETETYGLARSRTAMIRKDALKLIRRRSSETSPLAFAIGQHINAFSNVIEYTTPQSVFLSSERKALKRDRNTRAFFVVIPNGVSGGQEFVFVTEGNIVVKVTAPPASNSQDVVIVHILKKSFSSMSEENNVASISSSPKSFQVQVFDVSMPSNVGEGQPFLIMAGGRAFLISSQPGREKRFELHLPERLFPNVDNSETIGLGSTSNGWIRTLRIPDLSTLWVRTDSQGSVIESNTDIYSYALKRNVEFTDPTADFMLEGEVSLSYAYISGTSKCMNDAYLKELNYLHNIDLAIAQTLKFSEKTEWFRNQCSKNDLGVSSRSLYISVRREKLLTDTLNSIMSFSRKDLQKKWHVTFAGENSISSDIATREWFDLVIEEILHPVNGLFQFSTSNDMCIQINPTSGLAFPDSHLICFRVLGRILAKAIRQGYKIPNHLSPHIFKMLVGWPLIMEDLKCIDKACYNYFEGVQKASSQQLSKMQIPFTAVMDVMGCSEEVEVCPGGANRVVTVENRMEYLDLSLKHYLFGEVKEQLTEFLFGFYDVIPEPLLGIFNAEEVKILMCGVQNIDVQDWKRHTEYTGEFHDLGEYHPVCCWFWEMVENYLDEQARMQLLHYATGLTSLPSGGFADLQGENGQFQKFTLHGSEFEDCPFPKADTLINRIYLPLYESSDLMYETLAPSLEIDGNTDCIQYNSM